MVVVERLLKYRAEPSTGNRGELHKPGRLNHSHTTWWGDGCSELDWTILRSGHDPDRTTLLQACGAELDCRRWGEVLLRGRTYQMESDVPCLIGPSAPAVGCSRPQWVGWVVLRGWHGAWGNLKEKKPVRSGVSQAGEFSCAPCLLSEEKPCTGGQMGWEKLFPWQPEKAIPKVVLQPSPLGSSLEQGVRGAC